LVQPNVNQAFKFKQKSDSKIIVGKLRQNNYTNGLSIVFVHMQLKAFKMLPHLLDG